MRVALVGPLLLAAALALSAWLWSRPRPPGAAAAPSVSNIGASARLFPARVAQVPAHPAQGALASEQTELPGAHPAGRASAATEPMLEPAPVLGLEESAPSAASSPHDDFWRKYEERSREELERALNEVRAAKRPWMETTREARAESSSESGRAASVARQQLERLETEQAWLEARLAQLTSRPFARP